MDRTILRGIHVDSIQRYGKDNRSPKHIKNFSMGVGP
jgi:hypothetical protein